MYEHDSMIGESLSPRVAVNYLLHPAHGLRAVYAEAVRSPDMFEEAADWQLRVRDLRPAALGQSEAYVFLGSQAPGSLSQEKIVSRELGYNGHFSSLGLHLDLRLFDERDHRSDHPLARNRQFQPRQRRPSEFSWLGSRRQTGAWGYAIACA